MRLVPRPPARLRVLLVTMLLPLAIPHLGALAAAAAEPQPTVPSQPPTQTQPMLRPGGGGEPGARVVPPAWPQVERTAGEVSAKHATEPAVPQAGSAPAVTLTGSGWGHSVGMSQYGAQAMAQAGHTWQDVLRHYYTGVDLGSWAPAADDTTPVHTNLFLRRAVATPSRVDLRSTGRSAGTPTTAVRVSIGGKTFDVPPDETGLWVSWDPSAGQLVLHRGSDELARGADTGPVVVTPDAPAGANPALLRLPQVGGSGRLAGTFAWGRLLVHASPAGGGRLEPVLEQPLRTYLDGIAEVPSSWDLASQQAQAVAARTYVAGFLGTDPTAAPCRCQLGATPAYQNYVGWAHEEEASRYGNRWLDAVDGTRGVVASSGGRLAATYYSSSHGGRSENSEDSWAFSSAVPYLRSVDDPWSGSPANSLRGWTATVANADVARLVGLARVDTIAVLDRTAGGSPRALRVTGTDGAGQQASVDWSGTKGAAAALRSGLRVTVTAPSTAGWMTTLPSMQIATVTVGGQPASPPEPAPTPTPDPAPETPEPTPTDAVTPAPTPTPAPGSSPRRPDTWKGTFWDDDGSLHEAAVEAVVKREITAGCTPDDLARFCPEGVVTRGQMASFLARATDATTTDAPSFPDVKGSVHGPAVAALAESGVVNGFADGTFRPELPVTREQMASFLARALGLRPVPSRAFVFRDVVAGNLHLGAVGALQEKGISTGCGGSRFCPGEAVTRGQMATFLARALDRG